MIHARVTDQLRLAALAGQFLTRLPIRVNGRYSPARMARAVRYFPVVGIVVGIMSGLLLLITAQILPPAIAAFLAVVLAIGLTGALHEDGLADLADGLGGGATRARALEIMRDSRIGSYGALALGLAVALKIVALGHMPTGIACAAMIAAHGISRTVMVQVMYALPYARPSGAGAFAKTGIAPKSHQIALATGGVLMLGFALIAGIFPAVFGALGAALALGLCPVLRRKLGGYTGDGLGATQQLAEIGFYLGALACL